MTVRILAAGDHFVLNRLLVDALRDEVGDVSDIREITLPWPLSRSAGSRRSTRRRVPRTR